MWCKATGARGLRRRLPSFLPPYHWPGALQILAPTLKTAAMPSNRSARASTRRFLGGALRAPQKTTSGAASAVMTAALRRRASACACEKWLLQRAGRAERACSLLPAQAPLAGSMQPTE